MSRFFLAIDFGSTFTKVCLFDLHQPALLATARAPTTAESDVTIGLQQALSSLHSDRPFDRNSVEVTRACSSAAGGLKIVVIGLVRALSVEAAERAALGAGAKIVGEFSAKLSNDEIKNIEESGCDAVLLAGGTDGGDGATILHNANLLAESEVRSPIIVAGNKVVSGECRDILQSRGKLVRLTQNILPDLDTLNVEPLRETIRELFMTHIVHAKGIDKAQKYVDGQIIPTPSSVLRAAQLLAEGTDQERGLGEVVVIDVGGATTDVHSIGRGEPSDSAVIQRGLPEPMVKRTVEGDLGLRENAINLVRQSERRRLQKIVNSIAPSASDHIDEFVRRVSAERNHIPSDEIGAALDAAMARMAVELAMERHAGTIQEVYTPMGAVRVQNGKDLSGVQALVGAGGVLAHGADSRMILEGATTTPETPFHLKPKSPTFYVDRSYILYAVGLLADLDASIAYQLAMREIVKV